MTSQFDFDQAAGQGRGVNWHWKIIQHMGDRADMIFMSMRYDNTENLIRLVAQIVVIGNNVIDPEHVVFGKHNSRIDDQDLMVEFVGSHVLADFPKSTQGNDFQFSVLSSLGLFYLTNLNFFIRHGR